MHFLRAKRLLNLVGDRLYTLPLVILYLTDGCNSRCVTCDIWRNPRRNITLAMVDDIASVLHELGVGWVLLSGGEAMQHPRWPTIARRLRAEGVHVMLLTNGLLLRKQSEDVLASVDEVFVSLDGGTAETYRAIRGVDAFDLVLDGIRAVHEGGLPVTTRTTIQRANYAELPLIVDAAHEAGASSISFLAVDAGSSVAFGPRFAEDVVLPLTTSGPGAPPEHGPPTYVLSPQDVDRFAAVIDALETSHAADFASGLIAESPAKLRRMVDYFRAVLGQIAFSGPRCNAPHVSVVIEVDGTLRPCYFLPGWGRLSGQGLPSAINEKGAVALRHAYRTGRRAECARCVCPLYMGPRRLLRM